MFLKRATFVKTKASLSSPSKYGEKRGGDDGGDEEEAQNVGR